jgi:hypothetical protein
MRWRTSPPACRSCNSSKRNFSVEYFLRDHPHILERVRKHQAGVEVLADLEPGEKPRGASPYLGTKGQTLRLRPEAWRQLKLLALERDTSAHALMIEAVNSLFQEYGKQPIA